MIVLGVLCLVDREQGGRNHIEQALAEIPSDISPSFLPIFAAADVRKAHRSLNP
jgi:orotate phosphoribosyltransferase